MCNPNATIDYIVNQKNTYLKKLAEKTGRNVILYFSGFLQKQPSNDASINDLDINAFMENIYGLDKSRGLGFLWFTVYCLPFTVYC
jgi:hypothetical protein